MCGLICEHNANQYMNGRIEGYFVEKVITEYTHSLRQDLAHL